VTEPQSPVRFEARPFAALAREEIHDLVRLRLEVFVVEQRITVENELDGLDVQAEHVLGKTPDGRVVATARLVPVEGAVKVGRIVVDRAWRGRGVGRALMLHVDQHLGARGGVMSAQAHLVGWYESLGWRAEGPVYDEAGIPHRLLRRDGRAP
jgi:ElaA protein